MKNQILIPTALAVLAFSCTRNTTTEPTQTEWELRTAPETLAPAITKADAAIDQLRKELGAKLKEELGAGGPTAAVNVCKQEAPAIAARVSETGGVKIGRTSPKLRNPANAPPEWLAVWTSGLDGKRASEVKARVFDLGDRVGVVRPIPTAKVCTTCHGAEIDPSLAESLRAAYPKDRATGFAIGDLRGVFWVEVPK